MTNPATPDTAISIHAPREGSDGGMTDEDDQRFLISIHAPREGSDITYSGEYMSAECISIHAPREGSDDKSHNLYYQYWQFQSTLPARGATQHILDIAFAVRHFNPRSPRGERRGLIWMNQRRQQVFQSTLPARGATSAIFTGARLNINFNPRSPRGERQQTVIIILICFGFQSTLPARGATFGYRAVL